MADYYNFADLNTPIANPASDIQDDSLDVFCQLFRRCNSGYCSNQAAKPYPR